MKLVSNIVTYFRRLLRFIGPGFMVAVGYLDPGNWATDMEGGSQFGYRLLFIILISNFIAIFLQNLTIRLGTVNGLDLAAACRRYLPKYLNLFLYVLAEISIISTDLAEVIGSAIALNLLFPTLPLSAGVAITALDVFIILLFYKEPDSISASKNDDDNGDQDTTRMVRYFEMFVMLLVAAVGICFIIELAYSDIVAVDVLKGYLPSKEIFTDTESLYVSIGIIGATVMPHNLFLHSYIVQARCYSWRHVRPKLISNDLSEDDPQQHEADHIETTRTIQYSSQLLEDLDISLLRHFLVDNMHINLHYSFMDLMVALLFAFFVNSAILIVASANFHYGHLHVVSDLFDAHALLQQYLGPAAAVIFALALLFAGQSSTLTATLAGQ
ncbi:NRAMP family, partial [Halteromyces radiatus]|uniref:NRAMP family n=1 Tax=Halteromyces radiatus TaxID=101107 RepID=UPI00221FF1F9